MAKHILRVREVDRDFFEAIRLGAKTIETRAATNKYRKIEQGDILEFTCGKNRLVKKVNGVSLFEDIDTLAKTLGFKRIMPQVSSLKKAKEVWQSFPKYREKIKKYGIIAFELG